MISVPLAKEQGLIPEAWHNVIPDKCLCGSEFVISENLKTTKCSGDTCYIKLGLRAALMLYNLGVRGVGEEYCKSFFRANPNSKYHTDILTSPPDNHNQQVSIFTRIENVKRIQESLKEPRTFRQVVALLELPKMKEVSNKLFFGFNSFEEVLNNIEEKRNDFTSDYEAIQDWIAYRLRIKGVKTIEQVASNIINYAGMLNEIPNIFNIVPDAKEEIVIAITGSPFLSGLTKDKYIEELNTLAEGLLIIRRKDSVSGVQYVLADGESNSSKYLYGKERGLLINSIEFRELIMSKVYIAEDVEERSTIK